MLKKYCLVIFSFVVLSIILAMPAYAQSIGLSLTAGTQSPITNDIPFDFAIASPQGLTNVTVQWIIPSGFTTTNGESPSYATDIIQGSTTYDHYMIHPQYPGHYTVTADVSGVYQGNPYNQSATVNFTIYNAFHMNLNSGGFTLKLVVDILLRVAAFALFCYLVFAACKYLQSHFLKWLNKEG